MERVERHQPAGPDAFPTKDAAIAYCDKHGLEYHLVPAPPVRLKLQAYADNFR